MSCQEKISISWAYYTNAHYLAVTVDTTQRKPLPNCLGGARALPLRGRGTRWRRYRVTKRGNYLRKFSKEKGIKTPPLTLKGTGGSFYLEGVLLITCSVSYSKALTCFTDFGIVYHRARPALRTVLTSSCPPSGRCSIAMQER